MTKLHNFQIGKQKYKLFEKKLFLVYKYIMVFSSLSSRRDLGAKLLKFCLDPYEMTNEMHKKTPTNL